MRYEAPETVERAAALLAESTGEARVLAGGTDLLVQMRADVVEPALIVDIKRIAETRAIVEDRGGWRIGAAVTGAELKEHPRLKQGWPGVVEAANLIGSTQVQGRATLGGNLCNGSPAADSVPALIAGGGGHRRQSPRPGRAGSTGGGRAGGLRADRRQAGHGRISYPGGRRAGAPCGLDRAGPGEDQLMAKHHVEAMVNGDAVEFLCETE